MWSLVVALMVVACCGPAAASPALARRSLVPEGVPLPAGLPLEVLFASCGADADQADIGPCLEQLLQGVIELATPSFASGLEVGGKTVVLEPLEIKDVKGKNRPGKLQVSAENIEVAGISTVSVRDVTLLPDELALTLSFAKLEASGDVDLRYKFITASPQLVLTLNQPSVQIRANWQLAPLDGKIGISLSNVAVNVDIESFSTQISGLSGLGRFLETIINANNQILLDTFKPQLEKKAKRLLEKEFKTIKLGGL